MKLIEKYDHNFAARTLWSVVALGGACAMAWSAGAAVWRYSPSEWLIGALLGALMLVACKHPLRIPNRHDTVSPADTFIFTGALLLGVPAAVMLAAFDGFIGSLNGGIKRKTELLAASAMPAIAAFIAAKIFYLTLNAHGISWQPLGWRVLENRQLAGLAVGLAGLAAIYYLTSTWLVASLHAVKQRTPAWRLWYENYLWTAINFFAAAVAAGLIHQALTRANVPLVLLGCGIVVATIATYKIYFERVNQKTREAEEAGRLHLATVEALAAAIDAKDQMTHFHIRRVQHYCVELGKVLSVSPSELEALRAGALLHDIGKLAVPDYILNKSGELTAAEFERMKIHTHVGAQILERVRFPYPVLPLVLYHHERWDGKGYPEGLSGEQIPLTARILAVADAFDTVREARPYRAALSREEAGELLRRGAGTHFDKRVVEAFLTCVERFENEVVKLEIDFYGHAPIEGDMRGVVSETLSSPSAVVPPAKAFSNELSSNRIDSETNAPSGDVRGGVTGWLPGASNVVGGKRDVSASTTANVNQPATALTLPSAIADLSSSTGASSELKTLPSVASSSAATVMPTYLSQIRDAHREAHALYESARTFGASLDVQAIARKLIDKVGGLVPFEVCAVYLFDEAKSQAQVAHAAGHHSDLIVGRSLAPGEGLIGFVLANRCAVKGASGRFDPMLDWAHVALPGGTSYHSAIGLPLIRGEQLLGALVVYATAHGVYTNDHLRLLETVTQLASDALGNALHHAEIESNALTDALTGLPNARALAVRYEEEVARARRNEGSFQLVMLDLDNFKKVNDSHGHKAGDQLLRDIARVLSSQLREYDFLARYAGDEFVAIVQDLDLIQTAELSRRIERAVLNYSLPVSDNTKTASVGISIGAARYPSDGASLDALVVAADAAMYDCKAEHKRNRTARPHSREVNELASSAVN